jgi:hypothetical protein
MKQLHQKTIIDYVYGNLMDVVNEHEIFYIPFMTKEEQDFVVELLSPYEDSLKAELLETPHTMMKSARYKVVIRIIDKEKAIEDVGTLKAFYDL